MPQFHRTNNWLSTRMAELDDDTLLEMLKDALDHMEHGLLADSNLVSLEREYRQQAKGVAVNPIREVEMAVAIELAMRYGELK